MYKKIQACFKNPMRGKILGISGIRNFYPLIDMKNSELIETQYPEIDAQNLPFPNDTFDFVISDQVIEHLENPQKAIDESYRVLKKGGTAIHTTVFIYRMHYGPKDFYRFSPDALCYLHRDFSEIIQCEGWGNHIAVLLCLLSDKFCFINIPETRWSVWRLLATHNNKKYPLVAWVVARK